MSNKSIINSSFKVNSPNVKYDDENNEIISKYVYKTTIVTEPNQISVVDEALNFKTNTSIPKLGVMLVGWGGNNGTTLTAGILANKLGLKWATKDKEYDANYYGSLTQSSTVKIGYHSETKESVHIPFKYLLPMVEPNDIVVGGWDISSMNIGDAMKRAKVIDYDLQKQLYSHLTSFVPLPSIYDDCFIAANQVNRADNVISGTKKEKLIILRKNIFDFKSSNKLDKVIVLWTANTEKFSAIEEGVNDTAANLMSAIERNEADISPSTLFAVASILEGCSYINGSPSNTFVPGVIELAEVNNIFICGDDFKSGQTKLKSVLVDFLVSAGIKPVAIVSYNHLGNNDGYNLSAPEQFRSKEISKSNVVNDIVNSNRILYREDEHPDHCVVIKYVPYVGDSKRALDEYTSEIFLGGKNTIVIHNTCEDSLLATPIMLDLIILCELCERIKVKRVDEDDNKYVRFHCVLSLLSYLMKAPLVPQGTPVINALFAQRQCIVNVFRACLSLPPDDNMALEYKIPFLISPSKHGLNLVESEIVHLNGTLTSNNSNGIETSNGKSKRQKLIE